MYGYAYALNKRRKCDGQAKRALSAFDITAAYSTPLATLATGYSRSKRNCIKMVLIELFVRYVLWPPHAGIARDPYFIWQCDYSVMLRSLAVGRTVSFSSFACKCQNIHEFYENIKNMTQWSAYGRLHWISWSHVCKKMLRISLWPYYNHFDANGYFSMIYWFTAKNIYDSFDSIPPFRLLAPSAPLTLYYLLRTRCNRYNRFACIRFH